MVAYRVTSLISLREILGRCWTGSSFSFAVFSGCKTVCLLGRMAGRLYGLGKLCVFLDYLGEVVDIYPCEAVLRLWGEICRQCAAHGRSAEVIRASDITSHRRRIA